MNDGTMQRVARLRAMVERLKNDPDVDPVLVDDASDCLGSIHTKLRVLYWERRDSL
jgi:hypothetical protein